MLQLSHRRTLCYSSHTEEHYVIALTSLAASFFSYLHPLLRTALQGGQPFLSHRFLVLFAELVGVKPNLQGTTW
jgi:hypothetical protein